MVLNHKKLESGDRRFCSLTTGNEGQGGSGGRNKERMAVGGRDGESKDGASQKRIPRLSYYLTKMFLP